MNWDKWITVGSFVYLYYMSFYFLYLTIKWAVKKALKELYEKGGQG